jgi:hypothetical protein
VLLISGILLLFLYALMMKIGIEIDLSYWVIMILLICGMMELYKPVVHLLKKGWMRIKGIK